MPIADYNSTPGLNTAINGINVAEGCAPGNINDAIRQMMADLKTYDATTLPAAYQAKDADLTAIAGLTSAADRLPYYTGAGTAALATFTAAGRALVDDADAAAQRTTLGLGALATAANVTTAQIEAGTLVTEAEGIASNDNDTTIPTSAAVKGYADGLFFRLNSAHVGADVSTAQGLFPLSVSLEANSVYEYELVWSLSKTAGATSHTLSTGFGGTATLNNIQRNFAFNASTTTTSALAIFAGYLTTATSTLFAGALASATINHWNREIGTVSIANAGTFIPQYTLSAAPGGAYSTNVGSYFRLRRLGASGANLSSGSWA